MCKCFSVNYTKLGWGHCYGLISKSGINVQNHHIEMIETKNHRNATQFIYFYINSVFKRKKWQKTAFLLSLHLNPSSGLHCCNFSFFYLHSLSGCYIISNKSKGVYSSSLLTFTCGLLVKKWVPKILKIFNNWRQT